MEYNRQFDELCMRAALEQACLARRSGEVPVGAVLAGKDGIIARGYNSPRSLHDPSAHAEVVTLRRAGEAVGNYRMPGTVLYVTIEPCIMCMGALVQARVDRLVYGAPDPRAGAAGTVFDFSNDRRLNHRMDVCAGVLEHECRAVLQVFFEQKR